MREMEIKMSRLTQKSLSLFQWCTKVQIVKFTRLVWVCYQMAPCIFTVNTNWRLITVKLKVRLFRLAQISSRFISDLSMTRISTFAAKSNLTIALASTQVRPWNAKMLTNNLRTFCIGESATTSKCLRPFLLSKIISLSRTETAWFSFYWQTKKIISVWTS